VASKALFTEEDVKSQVMSLVMKHGSATAALKALRGATSNDGHVRRMLGEVRKILKEGAAEEAAEQS
jgi:hypothetical protein